MKRKIIVGIVAIVVLFAGLLAAARSFYPTNIADTATSTEERLRTRRYKTDLKTFVAEAEKIVPALSTWGGNWKHVSTATGENTALIKAEVPVVVFTDDLEIKAEADAAGVGIVVNARSGSRVGKSDLGENRRHILQLLEALDARFERR